MEACCKNFSSDHGCSSESCDYELRQCFPCVYRPFKFFIVDRLPFIKWLRRYTPKCFISDLIAGLTVALMLVPQALAYATIAGLPLRVCLRGEIPIERMNVCARARVLCTCEHDIMVVYSYSMDSILHLWDVSCTPSSVPVRTCPLVRQPSSPC